MPLKAHLRVARDWWSMVADGAGLQASPLQYRSVIGAGAAGRRGRIRQLYWLLLTPVWTAGLH